MRILIVGAGALGGTIATHALNAGMDVQLATRDTESANALRKSGLRVSGIGGDAALASVRVAAVGDYDGDSFNGTTITIGGVQATFLNAVLSPGSAGLYQIAIQLPASMPSGVAAVHASVGGMTSPTGINLFIL